jgi:hypothetical protein
MQNFTTLIVDMVKRENLFASQGGPVILAQVYYKYILKVFIFIITLLLLLLLF